MHTYHAQIDGGDGGEEFFDAETAKDALTKATAWAREGDWGEGGITVRVYVERVDDETDALLDEVYIDSDEEVLDQRLAESGTALGEHTTADAVERVVALGADCYHLDGQNGPQPLLRQETRDLLSAWGYAPAYVEEQLAALDAA